MQLHSACTFVLPNVSYRQWTFTREPVELLITLAKQNRGVAYDSFHQSDFNDFMTLKGVNKLRNF